jgi:pimeloyl-ACP methyl ester carboxylesterase
MNGVRLHIRSWGDLASPLLVLLHGGGAGSHWWNHIAPAFADAFRVVALDFRGHGASDYPEELIEGAFNVDLEALLEHLSPHDDVHLVGHSMGAHIASNHAARDSSIRSLVLIDISRGSNKRGRRRARLALALRRSYETREEAEARYRFLPDAHHIEASLRDAIARDSVKQEGDGRFSYRFDPRWFTLPSRRPPPPGGITCPTLIVRGAESEILSQPGAEELVAEIPTAQLQVIEGAGHHVQLDRPLQVIEALKNFHAGLG